MTDSPFQIRPRWASFLGLSAVGVVLLILLAPIVGFVGYNMCRVYVPAKHIAVLTKKTGKDLTNDQEIALDDKTKGLQLEVLTEGRHFLNPYHWDWNVYPMVEVPENRMGVRIRLYGKDLGYGEFVAHDNTYKGIVADELPPGRYPINAKVVDKVEGSVVQPRSRNDYVEIVELHSPVTIPAGYKGVVTNLSGPIPEDPNQLLVEKGFRGVERETLDEGTYYMNPYTHRIELIDCRSQRFNLSEGDDMGFPSKDGFWVSLDGIIEFRVKPEMAAQVYVTYNETENDQGQMHDIDQEIIRKVIMPNARSFCRLQGSNSSGRDFIGGETRTKFQSDFQEAIRNTCEAQGIEIVQALITRINPPQAIAGPVRDREVAAQQLKQFQQQQLQQEQEAKLATEKATVEQRKRLVEAEREVVKLLAEAKKRQEVALAEANRDKEVAEEELAAAKDKAAAIVAEKSAEAAVVEFENEADAAGWKRSVEALGGDGSAFARYVMYQKLAPGFRSIMTNTADSPLMDMFKNMTRNSESAGAAK
ncbi:MAG: SPFH domain-containing protein [Pirellulaceae bacterium]